MARILKPRYVSTPHYVAESDGTSGSPAFRFGNDTNTGFYRIASDALKLYRQASARLPLAQHKQDSYTTFNHPINRREEKAGKIDSRGGGAWLFRTRADRLD